MNQSSGPALHLRETLLSTHVLAPNDFKTPMKFEEPAKDVGFGRMKSVRT
jgi:hypothetical protein